MQFLHWLSTAVPHHITFNCGQDFSTLYSHLEAHLDVEKTTRENKHMELSIIQI